MSRISALPATGLVILLLAAASGEMEMCIRDRCKIIVFYIMIRKINRRPETRRLFNGAYIKKSVFLGQVPIKYNESYITVIYNDASTIR